MVEVCFFCFFFFEGRRGCCQIAKEGIIVDCPNLLNSITTLVAKVDTEVSILGFINVPSIAVLAIVLDVSSFPAWDVILAIGDLTKLDSLTGQGKVVARLILLVGIGKGFGHSNSSS